MALRAPFHVLSLCSGIGGLDLGIRLALPFARTVCYVEREAYGAAVLAARVRDEALDDAPLWSDLTTFRGGAWRGRISLVAAGYPCQPFSVAGRRGGADDPRHLWPHVARIVRECEPDWCFFENVAGHLTLGFRDVRAELRAMGYRVEAGLFTAAEVGAPHRRERLFVLAHAQREQWEERRSIGADPGEELPPTPGVGGGLADAVCQRRPEDVRGASADEAADGRAGRQRREPDGDHESDSDGEVPLFPPRPGDIAGWRALLALDPSLEPAICRDADGTAARVDQLRALGNAVVPLVAAHALRTLLARFGEY